MKKFLLICTLSLLIAWFLPHINAAVVRGIDSSVAAQQDKDNPKPKPESGISGATRDVVVFTGTVVRDKGEWSLMENDSKATFRLDDQDKAKAYEGKIVKVTGTSEPSSRVIHISTIEAGT